MNPLLELAEHGQSYWLDNLTRKAIESGELERRVAEEGLRGVTSNPNTFDKAIRGSSDYDAQIGEAARAGLSVEGIYDALVVRDVRNACDILRRVYDESGGRDGFVSLEVSPHLAHDTDASIEEAKRLFRAVDRPNVMIKIPGTKAGLPAVEELLYEGVNVNITLLFLVERYEEVAERYLRALERRAAAGRALDEVASVASFFLSRIDVLVDQLLEHRRGLPYDPPAEDLLGQIAVANAKLAYASFNRIAGTERWDGLRAQGARPQRLLWASTSTKNPDYRDVMYVEPLIGPHTVNTMPEATIAAFRDHGRVEATLEEGEEAARQVMWGLDALGIDFGQVTTQLENEGIQKFINPHDDSMAALAERRERSLARGDTERLEAMAANLRRLSIRMTSEAGSGHPTSSMSCADLVAALFFEEMRWDPSDPHARNVDKFVLSKGHAAPVLWAALSKAGAIEEDPLTLRRIDSSLEGHPTPNNPWIEVATGSLGQGLAAANGIALANRLDGIDARVYCLLGDGECSEGSVWEAAQFASLNELGNVVAIVDVNALGQTGATPYHHDTGVFARRFEAFGWYSIEIDGHDMGAILDALVQAREDGPTAIVARTEKGKGVTFLEGAEGRHGKALEDEERDRALAELPDEDVRFQIRPRRIGEFEPARRPTNVAPIALDYDKGDEAASRDGYGEALAKLGDVLPELVVLDGDVGNSTRANRFAEAHPERFYQSYIAEQSMTGAALGLAVSGKLPFAASFACFLTRAYDFIRMAGHSRPPLLVFCGSHAGVSVGEDGPSQMGLEDIAMFRAVAGSTVLCPADAVAAARLTEQAAGGEGIVYLRTARPKTPIIYDNDERFPIGGSKTLRASGADEFTVVAAGVTVHEALAAADRLAEQGVSVRVVDAYSIKPIDAETLVTAARDTRGLVVVEDHWPEGGLGEAVAATVDGFAPVHHLAVRGRPRSGTTAELLDRHGISRTAIMETIANLHS